MKYRVLSLKELGISGKQVLWDDGVEITVAGGHSEGVLIKEIRGHQVDMVMYRTEIVTPAMMDASSSLEVIVKYGVGLGNIGVEYAAEKDIQVVYTPLGNYNSVAGHVIVPMLMAARRYKHVDREFRNGNSDVRYTLQDTLELEGLTFGILDCGRIGQITANRAVLGFGVNVIGYDPYARQESMKAPIKLLENKNDVLARADFIGLSLPSLPPTRGSIDYAIFQKVKPKASFISCSRGDIIVGTGLIKVLQEGLTLGAGLSVFGKEPIEHTNPMLEMDDVIVTSHIAATTRQTVVCCCTAATHGTMEVMSRKPIIFPGSKID